MKAPTSGTVTSSRAIRGGSHEHSTNLGGSAVSAANPPILLGAVDRATFQAELNRLRVQEKAHTREGDADRRGPPASTHGRGTPTSR
jgi:hypothetical protein